MLKQVVRDAELAGKRAIMPVEKAWSPPANWLSAFGLDAGASPTVAQADGS